MATANGTACVWGISSTNLTSGTGVLRWNSQNHSRASELLENRDRDGEVIGVVQWNKNTTLEADLYPSGTSLANAQNANVSAIDVGNVLAIIDTTDTVVGATSTGRSYLVTDVRRTKSNTDKTVLSVTLRRWDGITDYTSINL